MYYYYRPLSNFSRSNSSPKTMLSRTVAWKIHACCVASATDPRSAAAMLTRPLVTVVWPSTVASRDDFPLPTGPHTPTSLQLMT